MIGITFNVDGATLAVFGGMHDKAATNGTVTAYRGRLLGPVQFEQLRLCHGGGETQTQPAERAGGGCSGREFEELSA
jgi:hypothetical protein